ncbi:hypothetical protein FACS1894172_06990 [Spirochaetia bacterium]|nr:hypothetical protein FACS1894164_08700 [Spirochaetia bacterium]GHU31682.1 hypothetical protein FACS1894172_06990 [Spirochaetia bacterium]
MPVQGPVYFAGLPVYDLSVPETFPGFDGGGGKIQGAAAYNPQNRPVFALALKLYKPVKK